MKAEFKDGHFNACYGGNTIYEKSTLQGMTRSDLIELIECAQHNYEILLDERWVEQAVKEYENSSQITADTKLWINTNLERMQEFLDELEER